MKPARRIALYLLSALLLVAAVLAGIRLHHLRQQAVAEVPPPQPAPWAVYATPIVAGTIEQGFPVLATVSARREITVSGQITGTLLEMGPREGTPVKAGEVLARIDTRELREQRDALQAELKGAQAEALRARKDRVRDESLVESDTISASAVDAARAAAVAADEKVRSLERQIRALEVRVGYGVVTAPAAGVVSARLAEPGDLCRPEHPIYRLTVSGATRITVRLPQSVLERVHPGTPLVLHHGDRIRRVTLDRIYPALDARALGAAEADLPERPFGLPSGARIAARVILEQQPDALKVPRRALLRGTRPGEGRVFRVDRDGDQDRLTEVPVKIGLEGHEAIAVDSAALHAGDPVVVAHESVLLRLRDGDPVRVFPGAAP